MQIIESLSKTENVEAMKCKYFYRIIKSSFTSTIQGEEVKSDCFGIEVERHDIINNCIVKVERESIERISPYRYKVHNLLEFITDNTVSPTHLIDVLAEYVDEYIADFDDPIENFEEPLPEMIMC